MIAVSGEKLQHASSHEFVGKCKACMAKMVTGRDAHESISTTAGELITCLSTAKVRVSDEDQNCISEELDTVVRFVMGVFTSKEDVATRRDNLKQVCAAFEKLENVTKGKPALRITS